MGRPGGIDRIDLILSSGRARSLADELPPGLRLIAAQSRSNALGQMTRAFHSNLTAMSLLAVLVGGFIIYNTMTFAVLRRRTLLGRLAGIQGRLAARGINSSISRTGIAVAALTVAVSATVGVGIMIDSFRGSVAAWLENTLSSDIYVSAPSSSSGMGDGNLPAGIDSAIRTIPGVADISKGRSRRIDTDAGPVSLLALESSQRSHRGFRFKGETAHDLWPRFEAGELALISEPYAFHHQAGVGDLVRTFTARGWREIEIGGVLMDYGADSGMLVLTRRLYAELWEDESYSTIGVVLAPGAQAGPALARLRTLASEYDQAIQVRANRIIREQSLEVFDRTFVITRVLRILAVGVAFIGVLSALMALQLERAREHAILRATGVTRGQLLGLILLQTSAMGIAAGLLATPLGWIMGALLNRCH